MEIKNGTVILEEAGGIDVIDFYRYMGYSEISGTKVKIPVKTLLRLYAILQYQVEKGGYNFEDFCQSVCGNKNVI